jgi:hypothetical protein
MICDDVLEPEKKRAVKMYKLKKSPETLRTLIEK